MAKVEEFVDDETKKAVETLSKEAEAFNESMKQNRFTWRIYDCDEALINDVIAISRLYFNNKCVDFLKWAVAQYKSKDNPDNFEEMFGVILLELQKMNNKKEEPAVERTEEKVKTFGSG